MHNKENAVLRTYCNTRTFSCLHCWHQNIKKKIKEKSNKKQDHVMLVS